VSRPPEKAMPTFSPLGRLFRIVLIKLPIGRNFQSGTTWVRE